MALIPPFFFDCVVAIGQQTSLPGNPRQWIGTGFLFGKFIQQLPENKREYVIYLITNKHVLLDKKEVIFRFNPHTDQPATDYPFDLLDKDGKALWVGHPDIAVDIAVVGINAKQLKTEGMKFSFFQSDQMVYSKEKMENIGTTEGDYIYVLGFPMGLVAVDRQHVILRSGAIARIRDLYEGRSKDFIIDALVFPGNSGGPVILRPEMVSIQGTQSNMNAALIGVVKSYIPYMDVAISQQTQRPRIIFEDNSGLALVEPTDYIIEAIEEYEKSKPTPPITS